ncbi:target snare coiled-coil region [Vairimorpha ceranae]|uniref:Target snare coiled-coil region n=1 Tax=Vairimorpha ceranae TaxID=40302 RepID=A0A0F9YUF1_9MICR|nr:target snare coiled-coil region [Vairimorpha ceranae]KKO76087.1 target snare coiled-coil region [Vairimorpha ceranae]
MKQEEIKLEKTSKKIKSVVIELSDKLNQQELLIESIENETRKNSGLMFQNLQNFQKLLDSMNRDPRNKIIFFLLITAVILVFYLLY